MALKAFLEARLQADLANRLRGGRNDGEGIVPLLRLVVHLGDHYLDRWHASPRAGAGSSHTPPGVPAHRPRLIQWTGARFRLISWSCLGLLILSGGFNLAYRGFGWADVWSGRLWQGAFGRTLGIKLLLVAVILAFSALHDFVIGPRARELWQVNPGATEALRLRRRAGWIGRVNLFLALIVVALGVMWVRGGL